MLADRYRASTLANRRAQHVRLYDTHTNVLRGVFPQKAAVLDVCWADRAVAYVGGLETSVKRCALVRPLRERERSLASRRIDVEAKSERVLGSHAKVGLTNSVNVSANTASLSLCRLCAVWSTRPRPD